MSRLVALVALVVSGAGCLGWGDWEDVPTATITPIAHPELQDAWTAAVAHEAAVWNSALERLGCLAPFTIGGDGHPIRLIAAEDWYDGAECDGATDGSEIRIIETARGVSPVRILLIAHELGHAIGLGHYDADRGPSVMNPASSTRLWSDRDAVAAACEMGCGPCAEGADPYSIR